MMKASLEDGSMRKPVVIRHQRIMTLDGLGRAHAAEPRCLPYTVELEKHCRTGEVGLMVGSGTETGDKVVWPSGSWWECEPVDCYWRNILLSQRT